MAISSLSYGGLSSKTPKTHAFIASRYHLIPPRLPRQFVSAFLNSLHLIFQLSLVNSGHTLSKCLTYLEESVEGNSQFLDRIPIIALQSPITKHIRVLWYLCSAMRSKPRHAHPPLRCSTPLCFIGFKMSKMPKSEHSY